MIAISTTVIIISITIITFIIIPINNGIILIISAIDINITVTSLSTSCQLQYETYLHQATGGGTIPLDHSHNLINLCNVYDPLSFESYLDDDKLFLILRKYAFLQASYGLLRLASSWSIRQKQTQRQIAIYVNKQPRYVMSHSPCSG